MTQNASVAAIVAAIISLLVEWSPGLAVKWHSLTAAQRQIYMALAVALVSAGTVGVNCAAYDQCPADWLAWVTQLFVSFLAAAAANQSVHQLTRRSKASVARLLAR
jgi:hypothetical protein